MQTKITYFYRNNKAGYSIAKVMNTITSHVSYIHQIEEFYVPEYRAGLIHVVKNILFTFKHRNKYGVNHITGDIHYCLIGLIGCKSVLTVHDLSSYKFSKNKLKRTLLKLLWFDIPLLIADKVVCISETIREELFEITKRKDIDVIYNALHPGFKPVYNDFNIDKPIILQIGTAWNKNVQKMAESINGINCHLRIIGNIDIDLKNSLEQNNIDYSVDKDLSDDEIVNEYVNCDIVSFCSLYEGFGMPIIEANKVGRCVITSNVNPMKEISNGSAILVNPHDVESIRLAFKNLICSSELRSKLIATGFKNSLRFEVEEITKLYINLYKELMADDIYKW